MRQIYISTDLKQKIIMRANNWCEYCHIPAEYSPQIFEIEHILPLSLGGTTALKNLAWACPTCNRYKSNRTVISNPQTNQETVLFNPRLHQWKQHFCWTNQFSTLDGTTTIGEVTIMALKMNRPSVQRFRLALWAVGLHPAQLDSTMEEL